MTEIRKNETAKGRDLRVLLAGRTGTDPEDWYLTFRAREAMQVLFEALKEERGAGDVVLQPFTCSTVPEAVLAGGLGLRYADISPANLSIDPASAPFDAQTRAVLCQHTYGMIDSGSASSLAAAAHACGTLFVEDAAQCVCRMARNAEGKPAADISVHSFGVEKMIPSRFGGACWINPEMADTGFRAVLTAKFDALGPAGKREQQSVRTYRTRLRILNHLPMKVRRPLREHWTARRRFIPAISTEELNGGTLLAPSVPGDIPAERVIAALADIEQNEAQRSAAVKHYAEAFKDSTADVTVPAFALETEQPLLWFPVLAGNKESAEQLTGMLNRNGYYSSGWGRPLLYPGISNPEVFRLAQAVASCPAAADLSDRIVLLPTNRDIADIEKVTGLIEASSSFVPVLLGTETNVYNMARAFYEAYGVRSITFGRSPLAATRDSKFVEVHTDPAFTEAETFVSVLNKAVPMYNGKKAILISCGDSYTRLLAKVKDRLDPAYITVCPDYESVDAVNSKVRFYEFCEKGGIPYPKTVVINDREIPALPFGFPLVLKPDNADDYNAHPFEGQKKAFILASEEELRTTVDTIYDAGCTSALIIQEFIPGGDENMRVVNGYIRTDGTPSLISMGQPLLEDYYPMAVGNYFVILASGNDAVYDTVERLVASIPYFGYFNLDLKYDKRDDTYKVFDFNPRMGRSSYYVTLAGHNLARCVVEDVIYRKSGDTVRSYDEVLWTDVPVHIIRKYIRDRGMRAKALDLIRRGKSGGTFKGAGENNPKRTLHDLKMDMRNIKNYRKYYKPKDGE